MILQSLHQLYGRLAEDPRYQVAPFGFSPQKITFRVVLRPDGELFEFQDARVTDDGRLRSQQILVPGGAKPSGSGLNPCFLWDNTGYMLGFKPDDTKPERTRESFEAFRSFHLELESEIDSKPFAAVCRFLERWDPGRAGEYELLADLGTGFGVFQILGETAYVHEDPAARSWWEERIASDCARDRGQCLVTGDLADIAAIHPKIKGVTGAQSSGAVIVGYNEDAYESYGRKQSHNAPVSEDAAFRYVTALNALLDGPMAYKHRFRLGDTTVVFWTERPTATENIFVRFISEGEAVLKDDESQDELTLDQLRVFLKALREGRETYADLDDDPERTRFYLLGLAPNAARLSVRFFHTATLGELFDNLGRHHDDIAVVRQPARGKRTADPEFPPNWLLLAQTAREPKEIPPILAGPLLRAVVTGTPYPDGLSAAVVRRIHADRVVNYARACVLKGWLVRNRKEEMTMTLDTERADPAYRLGRLFATLEKTQLDALGGNLNATIRDRFFGAASATPRSVFPRLLRTYQHHLAKLEGGRKVNREKLVQRIMAELADFPANLGLAGQGRFAIGYYHQMQDFYTSKKYAVRAGLEGDE